MVRPSDGITRRLSVTRTDRIRLAGASCAPAFFQPPLTAGTIEILDPEETGLASPPRVADVFIADENIDVLPYLSLLGYDAISNARVMRPECHQRLAQSRG